MKKISFQDVWPHLLAILVFVVVTVAFFNPIFFDNKSLDQHDITEFLGSSKSLRDYREATGEEGLWAEAMFSGMPAYLVNLDWSDGGVSWMKKVMALYLPHPVANIFLAFLSYYIMLLAFKVRPYLAIAGSLAFGLSSFIIIGLGAGHNGRIGAIAFMPLVIAGIHLAFTGKRILALGVTAAGLALHLRENHLQMTYYLMFIVGVYGLVQLIEYVKTNKLKEFGISIGMLVIAALLAAGTNFGQFWAIKEYSQYTIRGKGDLISPGSTQPTDGLTREYAFAHSNGIAEPLTLLVPNIMGGSSSNFLVNDQESETYKALVQSGDNQLANQLAQYSSSYWGPQSITAPYYAGAIIVFLFVLGTLFAEKKWVWWLGSLAVLSIVLTWGRHFPAFNYLMFDYFPGYNKFRSVTFALIIILIVLPLLGMLGLEQFMQQPWDKKTKTKLWIALAIPGGICFLLWATGGFGSFMRDAEKDLPTWYLNALKADRMSLLRSDAFRSLAFIASVFIVLYFQVWKRISPVAFYAFLTVMVLIDIVVIDRRYFGKDNFKRKYDAGIDLNESDQEILKDKSYYRVYNLQDIQNPFGDARTSYYHNSLSGYSGAKMGRYQDLYDSCMRQETFEVINNLRSGSSDFSKVGVLNMLNTKYFLYGPARNNFIQNHYACGNAWFVFRVDKVSNANDELKQTGMIDTRYVAVTSDPKYSGKVNTDSAASITLVDHKPSWLKYESNSQSGGLAVFSEIYYPHGWTATIDGNKGEILKVNYTLRALEIPSGKHIVEFTFAPAAYYVGDKITMAFNGLVVFILLGTIGLSLRRENE